MTLLIDAQLPPALARHLLAHGWPAVHVADLGLFAATDRAIWDYARDNGLVIVTKDHDFITLVSSKRRSRRRSCWSSSAIADARPCSMRSRGSGTGSATSSLQVRTSSNLFELSRR
ncbi:MAG: DUF5615 family PIN-like protein [Burkholderiales bacterium]